MKLRLEKINPSVFWLSYALVFSYILFKVFNVPITHDEVATTVHYSNYSYWEIMMYPDPWPNNHILNTVFAKFFISIFGAEQWVVRLPNVLSFLLFALGAYRIVKNVLSNQSKFFIPAALLLIASPYMLDFFSLCRGYGMSTGLCTLSVAYLITGFKHNARKDIWWSLVLAILASYANFTLLIFWAAITALVWFYFLVRNREEKTNLWKSTLMIIAISVGYLALIYPPIAKMRSTNQFEYWTSNGFFQETIYPLVQNSKYDSRIFFTTDLLSWFAVGLLIVNLAFVAWKWKKAQFKLKALTSPIAIATLVLAFTAGINIVQCWVLNTPNLNGRTALFFYPLFVIMLIASREMFGNGDKYHIKKIFAGLMTLLLVHHVVHTMKPYSVKEWEYDANTFAVIEYLENERPNEEVSLAVNWLFNPSFTFYGTTGKTPNIKLEAYNKSIVVDSKADYYYVLAEDVAKLDKTYSTALEFPNNCVLLKRNR